MRSISTLVAVIGLFLTIAAAPSAAQTRSCRDNGELRSVTKARSGGFETVTFEFVGSGLPDKAEVRDARPPIQNYGGENLRMKGKAFKTVFFALVPWMCKVRESFGTSTSTIRDIRQTEQFEGHIEYAIGYSSKAKFVGKSTVRERRRTKFIVRFKR